MSVMMTCRTDWKRSIQCSSGLRQQTAYSCQKTSGARNERNVSQLRVKMPADLVEEGPIFPKWHVGLWDKGML